MAIIKNYHGGESNTKDVREWYMNLRGNKKIDPAILSQIENGVSAKQYVREGAAIMHEVSNLIEQLKAGNYNNYINGQGSPH